MSKIVKYKVETTDDGDSYFVPVLEDDGHDEPKAKKHKKSKHPPAVEPVVSEPVAEPEPEPEKTE